MSSRLRKFFDKAREKSLLGADSLSVTTAGEPIAIPGDHPEYLSLIVNPLLGEGEEEHGGHEDHHGPSVGHHDEKRGSTASVDSLATLAPEPDEPRLRMPHEAPTIELFYDLYFVANLTVFSSQHEIHSWDALRSYVGFFTMIWFTWFQNTLFDVRFSNDSAFERVCKVLQFGVMTGLAMSGPGFVTVFEPDTDDAVLAVTAYRILAIILMASRLILALQYLVALFFLRSYKRAIFPMVAHAVMLLISGAFFLATYFLVNQFRSQKVLIGWYIVVVIEAAFVLAISGKLHFLSFRHTYLFERLGLLTLIILGEGIMTMCFALYAIGSVNSFSASSIGQIICCVLLVYCMWMLYFDAVNPKRMGNLRQHVWAVLHFPFHASVVFVVEGMAGLAIWRKVLDVTNPLKAAVSAVSTQHPTWDQVVELNRTMGIMVAHFLHPTVAQSTASFVKMPDQSESFEVLVARDASSANVRQALRSIYNAGLTYVCGKFKIEPHEHPHKHGAHHAEEPDAGDPTETDHMADGLFELFETVFVYFFAFAGAVLVLLAILFLLGKRRKLPAEYATVVVRMVVGIGLGCVAIISAPRFRDPSHNDALHHFLYSSWVLPTVVFAYLLGKLPCISIGAIKADAVAVIVLDNILMRVARKDSKRRAARALLEKEAQESHQQAFNSGPTPLPH